MANIIGIGCMSFTDDNVLVSVIRYAIQNTKSDILLNTAQFYGPQFGDNERLIGKTLDKLSEEEHSRLIVITKGGVKKFHMETEDENHNLFAMDNIDAMYSDAETFFKSWTQSKVNLGVDRHPNIRMGYFLHRRHPDPNEFTRQVQILKKLIDSKQITYTGLSEVSLKDIQHALTIIPIHFLESELSPNVQFLLSDGYVEFCKMHQITILAYSPLNRGFWSDITHGDYARLASDLFKSYLSMWRKDNFEKLFPMLVQVQKFAKRKGYTTSEVVLSWVIHKGCVPIAGSCSYANNVKNICAFKIKLTEEEVGELDSMVADMTVKFGIKRYK